MNIIRNSKGATLVYILTSFLVISFVGVAMTKLSHHEVKASSDFAMMRTAEEAARSGLIATVKFLSADSPEALRILNSYIERPGIKKILGDQTADQRIEIDGQLSFSTELLSFAYNMSTNTDFVATVRSNGFGKGGSRKSIVSVVRLGGLGWHVETSTSLGNVPIDALRADNGGFEINSAIDIHGSCSFSDGFHVTGNEENPKIFHGPFRLNSWGEAGSFVADATMVFRKNAYFGKKIIGSSIISCEEDVAFSSGYGPNVNVTVSGTDFSYLSTENEKKLALGFAVTTPPAITFDTSLAFSAPHVVTVAGGSVSIDDLNTYYADQLDDGELWDGKFLVVRVKGSDYGKQIIGNGTFNGKAIVIFTGSVVGQLSSIDVNDTSNLTIYIDEYASWDNTFSGTKNYRGFIYINSVSSAYATIHGKVGNANTFTGSVYATVDAPLKFDEEHATITFNDGVINELAVLGIFKDGSEVIITTPTDSLIATSTITSTLLGTQL